MLKRCSGIIMLSFAFILSGCSHGIDYTTTAKRLSSSEMDANGHKQMNFDYVDNNIISYDNADGTKTIYVYAAPIEKNIDEATGECKVAETETAYISKGSYTEITIPKTITTEAGIIVKDADNSIELLSLDAPHVVISEKRINMFGQERVSYKIENYFGEGVDLYCTPTSFGINLEYQLQKKPDDHVFRLKVRLSDTVPNVNSPDYIRLMDLEDNEKVQSLLYTPLCVDKKENWNYDHAIALADMDAENNTYLLESSLNKSYLYASETKYPVNISQSLYLYVSKEADTPVYSETDKSARHYLSPYMLFGQDSVKGEGYEYIRFPALGKVDLDPENIQSASYCFHNLFDLDTELQLQAFAVKADWCSVNTIWDSQPIADEVRLSETTMQEKGDYKLDVTELLREIIKNKENENALYSIRNSFYIKAAESGNKRAIVACADSGLFSPYLKIVVKEN